MDFLHLLINSIFFCKLLVQKYAKLGNYFAIYILPKYFIKKKTICDEQVKRLIIIRSITVKCTCMLNSKFYSTKY